MSIAKRYTFDEEWVKRHTKGEQSPLVTIINEIKLNPYFADVCHVKYQNSTTMIVSTETEKLSFTVYAEIRSIVKHCFSTLNFDEICFVTDEDVVDEETKDSAEKFDFDSFLKDLSLNDYDDKANKADDDGANGSEGGESDDEDSKITDEVKSKFTEFFLDYASRTEKHRKEKSEEPETSAYDDAMNAIGAKEFKALLTEIKQIAPLIIKNDSVDVFMSQSYIFSINDGFGLSTYLSKFCTCLKEFGLIDYCDEPNIQEEILPPPSGRDTGRSNNFNFYSSSLVCVDISNWMTSLQTIEFRNILKDIQISASSGNGTVIVFRVPFVEREVLNKVMLSLNDLMFVRSVCFPPLNMQELRDCATNLLTKRGFEMTDSAWNLFEARISDEKSDGKFYGMKTVVKVVNEIIYSKLCADANNNTESKDITDSDIKNIATSFEDDSVSGMEMLSNLVGSEKIVDKVKEIIAQIQLAKKSKNLTTPCLHMRFVGNPGTGKTTVARIVGKILRENGVLRVGNFFEYSGRDFVGRYIGETAPKVSGMCRDAYGSVLFIDEAYSLYRTDDNSSKDFGREALDTLIAEMENHRNDMVIIMAGYQDEMELLLSGNVGLASRMPYTIEFDNFSKEQLYEIFVKLIENSFEVEDGFLDLVKEYFDSLSDDLLKSKTFANARFVRNLFERTWGKASTRCQLSQDSKIVLTKDDFRRASAEKDFSVSKQKGKVRPIGFY